MTKEELKNRLPSDPRKFKRSPDWDEAYQLFNDEHPLSPVKIGCSSCAQKVLRWIKK